jgi:acyl-CoA reductase-like NAD-dependent aldehyde dehydrogenase
MPNSLEVAQAFDGALIETLELESWEAVDAKLAAAAAAHADRDGWIPAHERAGILRRLAELVRAEAEDFALLIAREGGKPLRDARVEVARAINGIENAAEEIGQLHGEEIPMGLSPASDARLAFTTKEPIGVVVAISAFNHPLSLIVHQVAPAIATGCPVLVKPADTTPLNCLRFVELVRRAGLPESWCQSVICDIPTAEKLATDPRVAFFSFIGSARVGWHLRSKLAPGTRCALEHGGAAPAIVDASADLEAVIPSLVKGGYYHSGQVCVSTQRIFVPAVLVEGFLDGFVAAVEQLVVGDPTSAATDCGPLILPREVDRVHAWVEAAVGAGAVLATGGAPLSATTYMPTVLVEPPADATVSTSEIFGPVTCVYPYTQIDEAIARANALPFAFQAAVYSADLDVAMRAGQRLDASAVMVNDHTAFRVDWMPFTGRGASGYGVGGIRHTMADMVQDKMLVLPLPG